MYVRLTVWGIWFTVDDLTPPPPAPATWAQDYVRSQLEYYLAGLGLVVIESSLGDVPITCRTIDGKARYPVTLQNCAVVPRQARV